MNYYLSVLGKFVTFVCPCWKKIHCSWVLQILCIISVTGGKEKMWQPRRWLTTCSQLTLLKRLMSMVWRCQVIMTLKARLLWCMSHKYYKHLFSPRILRKKLRIQKFFLGILRLIAYFWHTEEKLWMFGLMSGFWGYFFFFLLWPSLNRTWGKNWNGSAETERKYGLWWQSFISACQKLLAQLRKTTLRSHTGK